VLDNEGYGLRVCGVGAVDKRVDAETCIFENNRQGDELLLLESIAAEADLEVSQGSIDGSEGVVWEYEVDDSAAGTQSARGWKKGWVRYDHVSQVLLEAAYLSSSAILNHKQGNVEEEQEEEAEERKVVVYIQEGKYCLDLVNMEQTNVDTFYSRAIRRRVP